jgi:hypothetical protein
MTDGDPVVPESIWMEISGYKSVFIQRDIRGRYLVKDSRHDESVTSENEVHDGDWDDQLGIALTDVSIQTWLQAIKNAPGGSVFVISRQIVTKASFGIFGGDIHRLILTLSTVKQLLELFPDLADEIDGILWFRVCELVDNEEREVSNLALQVCTLLFVYLIERKGSDDVARVIRFYRTKLFDPCADAEIKVRALEFYKSCSELLSKDELICLFDEDMMSITIDAALDLN